jgi:hypothetical protein
LFQPKFTPVFTIRMLKQGKILVVPGQVQAMIDASVPRELLLRVLDDLRKVIAAGRSPEEISSFRL